MSKRIVSFIFDQVNKIRKGGPLVLFRKCLLLLIMPLSLLIVLFVRLIRPFVLIRFGKLESLRIGHFAGSTEIYLSERDSGIYGRRSLDFFYINAPVCNEQLKKMWSRVLCISLFVRSLDLINSILPGGDVHSIQWGNADRDISGVLESIKAHISFTEKEEVMGREAIKKLGIINGAPFICFLSRSPDYLNAMIPGVNWHYHGYRDSDIKTFMPAAEELTRRGYFALRMGVSVSEKLKTANPMIIDYATKYRTSFLDIYLGSKCNFYLGDSCGFHAIPMVFRRPLAITNMVPLEYAPTWGSHYLFIPKKLWLDKEGRFLKFRDILTSQIGRFYDSKLYEESGISVIENTFEEITALAIEMDQRLKGEWQESPEDEELQQRFRALFKSSELNRVFRARIGAEFLRQNKELLG